MKIDTRETLKQVACKVRLGISQNGYAVARVPDKDGYLGVCGQFGRVSQTRDILVDPARKEQYTGYSYDPDIVPFHTDLPLVKIVGLYCVAQDDSSGDNLLIDSRRILSELTLQEVELLTQIRVPLPRGEKIHPLLSIASDGMPHIYWLPAFIQPLFAKLNPAQTAAVTRFDQVLLKCREEHDYISICLAPGEALWFNNHVMLHGRDRLELTSARHLVRAFVNMRCD